MKITINGDVYDAVGQEISHEHICVASGISPENGVVRLLPTDPNQPQQEVPAGVSVSLEDGMVFECSGS